MDLRELLITKLVVCNLTKHDENWIHHFINNCPLAFTEISAEMDSIMYDGKIDVHDIPHIISVASKIYHSHAILAEFKNTDNMFMLIEFTMDCVIDAMSDLEKIVAKRLVRTSILLLKQSVVLHKIKRRWCFSFSQ